MYGHHCDYVSGVGNGPWPMYRKLESMKGHYCDFVSGAGIGPWPMYRKLELMYRYIVTLFVGPGLCVKKRNECMDIIITMFRA